MPCLQKGEDGNAVPNKLKLIFKDTILVCFIVIMKILKYYVARISMPGLSGVLSILIFFCGLIIFYFMFLLLKGSISLI
jgi:hypothetical protein